MRYTDAKAGQLYSMMKSFATKHELNVEITNNLDVKNHVYNSVVHVFRAGWKPKDYMFCWDAVESLSEGAAYIFADIIVEFRLNHKPVNYKMDLLAEYARSDVEATYNMYMGMNFINGYTVPKIQDVIFNDPATIVKWADGTKTVVKAQDGDAYDPEKGLAMAIAKKALGNKGNYNNEINKWLSKYDPPILYPEVMIKFDSRILANALHERMADIFGRDVISDVNKSIEETKH